jgi:hypothetical protein
MGNNNDIKFGLLDFYQQPYEEQTDGSIRTRCLWGKSCSETSLSMSKEGTHQFQCWKCKKTGNAFSWIREFYDKLPEPSPKALKELTDVKPGISRETLRQAGVKCRGGDWYIPVFKADGKLAALHKYVVRNNTVYSSPKPVNMTFLGADQIKKDSEVLFVTEGHWDYLALKSALPESMEYDIVGAAGTFAASHFRYLEGKIVIMLFDNDEAGAAAVTSACRRLKQSTTKVKSVYALDWKSLGDYPDKFDIRDLICDRGNEVTAEFLIQHCQEVVLDEINVVSMAKCTSFEQLVDCYREDLTIDKSFIRCLAVGVAVHISRLLTGDPLWIYLVGPPSSGKSTICELLAAYEIGTKCLSKFTGLMSGMGEGNHLISRLIGLCVIVKDGTLLLDLSVQQLQNILGELRDIYDGSLEAFYRNGVEASFSGVTFSMIIAITEKVYTLSMSALGERFMHIRLEHSRELEAERNNRVIDTMFGGGIQRFDINNSAESVLKFPKQAAMTAGFLDHLTHKIKDEPLIQPHCSKEHRDLLRYLGIIIAASRGEPAVDHRTQDVQYDATVESSTRVVKVLSRAAYCLCYVLGKKEIDQEVMDIVITMAHNTAFGRQYQMLHYIAMHDGIQRASLSQGVGIPLETVTRRIDALMTLDILEIAEGKRAERGRGVPSIKCVDWVQEAFRKVEKYVSTPLGINPHSERVKGTQKARTQRPPRPRSAERKTKTRPRPPKR